MTSQPDPIDAVLTMIAEHREVLTRLESSLLDVRRILGQPFPYIVSREVPNDPVPQLELAPRRTKANVPPPAPTFGPKPRAKREDVAERVLSFLADQTAPVMFAQIAKATGGTKAFVREAINGLVTSKRVVRHGVKAGQTIGLPAVMAAAGKVSGKAPAAVTHVALALTKQPTNTAPSAELSPLRVAIWKVLKTGASVDPSELRRKLDGKVPEGTIDNIVPELEALAASGRVERITISPTVRRYRALFPGRASA